jgi:hypothetical protein
MAKAFDALMYRQSYKANIGKYLHRLDELLDEITDPLLVVQMGAQLLLYHTWWNPSYPDARRVVTRLRNKVNSLELTPLSRLVWLGVEACYLWMSADFKGCHSNVEQGIALADKTGIHLVDFMLYAQGAWGALVSDDMILARQYIKKLDAIADERRRLDVAHLYLLHFTEALHREDAKSMLQYSQKAVDTISQLGTLFPEGVMVAALAIAHFYTGDTKKARELLEESCRIGNEINSKSVINHAYQVELEMEYRESDKTRFNELLTSLIEIHKNGFGNSTWWRNSVMRGYYLYALENNIFPEYVITEIKRRNLMKGASEEEQRRFEKFQS